jgi:hypothetical protein
VRVQAKRELAAKKSKRLFHLVVELFSLVVELFSLSCFV